MTELTRRSLNRYLPDDQILRRRVGRILGYETGSDDHMVIRGLEWLADKTEAERYPAVEWVGLHPWERAMSVAFDGILPKPSWGYMTHEGWSLGERCWIGIIVCGNSVLVTGEYPALVIARCVVVMDLCTEWRDTEPNLRARRLTDMIEAKISSGTWNRGL